jgi:ribosomal protein S18 acetylase RimI-like enzyme
VSLPGERDARRVAELPDRTTVRFNIPTRTACDASISYLGVLPGLRGHGYVHDLLAEMVHIHHDGAQAE